MVLIEGNQVEAKLLGITVFVDIVVIVVGGFLRIEKTIRDPEKRSILENFFFRYPSVRSFSKVPDLHVLSSQPQLRRAVLVCAQRPSIVKLDVPIYLLSDPRR